MKVVKAALFTLSLAAGTVWAGPPAITQAVTPGTVSYQGQVQAADGSAYADGLYGIEFRLYDEATDGTMLWGAKYEPYLKGGFFSVILGQTDVGESTISGGTYTNVSEFWKAVWIDPNSANKERFLGIKIVSELGVDVVAPHESFPRQQLQASPFAIQAQFAQQAEYANQSIGDFTVGGKLMTSSGTTELRGNVNVEGTLQVGHVNSGAGNELWLWSDENSVVGSAKGVFLEADDKVELKGKDIFLTATDDIELNSTQNILLAAGGEVVELQGSEIRFDRHADKKYTYPLHAPANGMRMAYAHVQANGTIVEQSGGFSLTKIPSANGYYHLDFTAFDKTPKVVLSVISLLDEGTDDGSSTAYDSQNNIVTAMEVTASNMVVTAFDAATDTREDTSFDIILIGVDN